VILVLRALGLGDLLTVVPALRGIRRQHDSEEIVLAAPASLAPLVARLDAVDRLLVVPSAVSEPPVPFRAPAPTIAVNLHGRGPQSTEALRSLGPCRLWAYGEPGAPPWLPDEHEVVRWCRLVSAYGDPADPGDLYLDGDRPRNGPAVVHPGAADPARRWPPERFAAVARGLVDRGLRVWVTGGPAERALALDVVVRAGRNHISRAPAMDLAALADVVAASPLVVCGDTGVAHLATACRTPSVVLFGPQPPSRWGPPPDPRHRALWAGPASGDACPAASGDALLRLRPADVLAAADAVLGHGPTKVRLSALP
jgi:ADP-heptose:LPS heptosyltransferase